MCVTYWQLGERWVADMPSKHLLLELQQLDDQTREGLVGGRLRLDVLKGSEKGLSLHQDKGQQESNIY